MCSGRCVNADAEFERLVARLTGRNHGDAKRALSEAMARPDRDLVLATALDHPPRHRATSVASFLGDIEGDHGVAALRRATQVTGRGASDIRGVAALALAKRCGAEATPWLMDLVPSRDTGVTAYVLTGLAGAGDARAWERVLELVPRIARYRTKWQPPLLGYAIAYLAQHIAPEPDRKVRLVSAIRSLWDAFDEDERAWLGEHWPEAAPTGPAPAEVPAPSPSALRTWARTPLFNPRI